MLKHLACIMDGNRRWARKLGKNFNFGYREGGKKTVDRVIDFCLKNNIPYLSLYAFSIENFKRPKHEQEFIFDTLVEMGDEVTSKFVDRGVRIKFVGDRSLFPKRVLETCKSMEEQTRHLDLLTLNVLFCYGSRQEILSGIKEVAKKVASGSLEVEDISLDIFEECLWMRGIPEPDVILRTSGTKRLSNFLLYQSAYTEFYFLDCMWPEITHAHLEQAVDTFNQCQRNVGA